MAFQEKTPMFWMGGRLATDLIEISDNPSSLQDGGFWAVSTTFEGGFTAAKFASVIDAPFPNIDWEKPKGSWASTFTMDGYIAYVEAIREEIARGGVYQVNACRKLKLNHQGNDLRGLFSELLKDNPAPWASYLGIPGLEIASASPELFLRRRGSKLITSPIKGTQPLARGEFGEKDRSENIMIVDLMRNDFSKICKSGSVEVPRLLSPEDHPGLAHLVSDVAGELLDGISWSEIFQALSPPGSVSGAPKSSAIEIISKYEDERGPYCGSLGWIEGDQASMSVAIRVFWSHEGLNFGTGAGITWSSDALAEWEETELKAKRLISIAGGNL